MEVTIQCPHCQMELEAPAELEGKPAICPNCQEQFIVQPINAAPGTSAAPRTSAAPLSEPTEPKSKKSKPKTTEKRRPTKEKGNPTSKSVSDAETSMKTPRFKGLDAHLLSELQGESSTENSPAPSPKLSKPNSQPTPPEPKSTRNSAPEKRQRKTARLLSNDASETWLPLGNDGELPQLVVKDEHLKEVKQRESKESNPLILILILVMSVAMSLLLLFVPEELPTANNSMSDSVEVLQQSYIGTKQPLEPYQILVRSALELENEGERAEAKVIYRQLLDMLHAERRNPNEYLTGPPFSSREPNDRSFEYHLKILLSNR